VRAGETAADAGVRVERAVRVRRVLQRVLVLNVLLAAAKAVVGMRVHSLAVVGGAIDSGVDVLTTLLSLALARVAAQEPDERHPYGHQKFEALGALAMVAFLSITVYELVRRAVAELRGGGGGEVHTSLALWVMLGSLVVGLLASIYELRRGRQLGSHLLVADAAHLRADVFVTLAVLAGLLLSRLGYRGADAWTTLFVSLLIARTGWEIVVGAVPVLVDERAVEADEITRLAGAMHGVRGVYDVRSRGRQGAVFAELTIAVHGEIDVETAHEIADTVEHQLSEKLGAAGVTVHVEPVDRRAARDPLE
jgi:cation diffusion facilitator family transporter